MDIEGVDKGGGGGSVGGIRHQRDWPKINQGVCVTVYSLDFLC